MAAESEAVFVIDTYGYGTPGVSIYRNLAEARGSVESLDVRDAIAFTESGQLLSMTGAEFELYADLQCTGRYDLDLLRRLLHDVGPTQFADDPSAYAREWFRLDELDSHRPPIVPKFAYWWWLRLRRRG